MPITLDIEEMKVVIKKGTGGGGSPTEIVLVTMLDEKLQDGSGNDLTTQGA